MGNYNKILLILLGEDQQQTEEKAEVQDLEN